MRILRSVIILSLSAQPIHFASVADITGAWVSRYYFSSAEEVMTANNQHVGGDFIEPFLALPSIENPYPGILFGRVEGDRTKENHQSAKTPQAFITFTDSRLGDQNSIKGTYYVKNSDVNAISGAHEAKDRGDQYVLL